MDAGIQFMLRMEREAEVQRHSHESFRNDFVDEKSVRSLEQDNPIKRIFNLFRQRLTPMFQQGDESPCQTRTKIVSVTIEDAEQCECA